MDKPFVLRIAVCEDEQADAALLKSYIEKSGVPSDPRFFTSAEEFLASFRAFKYDLIFMDVYMEGMLGIEAVRKIRGADENVVIAFTTNSPDHTLESYRLGAIKYLEKPVSPGGVAEALSFARLIRENSPRVTLKTEGGGREDVPLDSIMYFEQQNYVVAVHTASRVFTTSRSVRLDELEKSLPSPPFLRCHRSYLINLNYAHTCDREKNAFIMKNGDRADMRRGGFAKYRMALDRQRLANAKGRE